MTFAPQITFRNMDAVPELEEAVLKEAEDLERFFARIVSCHVIIEGPRRHEHLGLFDVHIDLVVPGKTLVVKQSPNLGGTRHNPDATEKTKASEPQRAARDAGIAIHRAFHEMRRQLQDCARCLREPAPGATL